VSLAKQRREVEALQYLFQTYRTDLSNIKLRSLLGKASRSYLRGAAVNYALVSIFCTPWMLPVLLYELTLGRIFRWFRLPHELRAFIRTHTRARRSLVRSQWLLIFSFLVTVSWTV
jgi:hypothetical protein